MGARFVKGPFSVEIYRIKAKNKKGYDRVRISLNEEENNEERVVVQRIRDGRFLFFVKREELEKE